MRNILQDFFEMGVATKLRHKYRAWHPKSPQSAMASAALAASGKAFIVNLAMFCKFYCEFPRQLCVNLNRLLLKILQK